MTRLGLAVTDPNDLPFIYDRLRSLAAPNKIHIDDSELVTGTFPVPSFENGAIGVRARGDGRAYLPHEEPPQLTTLNWSDALWLTKAWDSGRDSVATIPPFRAIHDTPGGDAPSCHIAVIGACEGEAMLLANWAHRRRADVESLLGVAVASVSWLATDIAPIGHLVLGTLQAVPVMADTWVVVAVSTRLQHCKVTGLITETLKWAGVPHATVAVDKHRNNVQIPPKVDPPKSVDLADLIVVVDLTTNPPRTHAGGLFQWQLQDELL